MRSWEKEQSLLDKFVKKYIWKTSRYVWLGLKCFILNIQKQNYLFFENSLHLFVILKKVEDAHVFYKDCHVYHISHLQWHVAPGVDWNVLSTVVIYSCSYSDTYHPIYHLNWFTPLQEFRNHVWNCIEGLVDSLLINVEEKFGFDSVITWTCNAIELPNKCFLHNHHRFVAWYCNRIGRSTWLNWQWNGTILKTFWKIGKMSSKLLKNDVIWPETKKRWQLCWKMIKTWWPWLFTAKRLHKENTL